MFFIESRSDLVIIRKSVIQKRGLEQLARAQIRYDAPDLCLASNAAWAL
jgi:hypothetical protein